MQTGCKEAFTDAHITLRACFVLFFPTRGGMNAPMTLKIRVEIKSVFAMKTQLNSSFQLVYWLPARPRKVKLCVQLRTANAPIKAWLSGWLAHTIDAFCTVADN